MTYVCIIDIMVLIVNIFKYSIIFNSMRINHSLRENVSRHINETLKYKINYSVLFRLLET